MISFYVPLRVRLSLVANENLSPPSSSNVNPTPRTSQRTYRLSRQILEVSFWSFTVVSLGRGSTTRRVELLHAEVLHHRFEVPDDRQVEREDCALVLTVLAHGQGSPSLCFRVSSSRVRWCGVWVGVKWWVTESVTKYGHCFYI